MVSIGWRNFLRIVVISLLAFPVAAFAQDDPDPNSPTPVLLTEKDSKRAQAVAAGKSASARMSRLTSAFKPNSKVILFAANLDLEEDEGANAFRIYAQDSKGRGYRFPVMGIQPVKGQDGVFAVTVLLRDEIGFWEQPAADGDISLRLSWRGMTSNWVRLGYGKTGGALKDPPEPEPFSAPDDKITSGKYQEPNYVGYRFAGDRKRFLEQAAFGPTTALDLRVRRIGLRTWVAEQFEMPYPSAAFPYPNIPLKSTDPENVTIGCGMFTANTPERRQCDRDHYSMYPVQNWFFKEAFYGDAQLRHRVSWALAQIWVISGVDTQQSSWMIAYHKVLSQNAFGNYRTLMEEMTLNPGMGNYLDMVRSTKNNPNENYAREIKQLFTIGLFMLNQDGTVQVDGGGNPLPTYTQDTVNNFTKVFTGWNFCNTGCPNSAAGIINYKDPLILVNTANHDLTAKTLLAYPGSTTTNVAACTGCNTAAIQTYAANSMDQALDNIFNHPSLAPYVSKVLIQHMVTSDPSPAYVSRVVAAFNNNGAGVRGDMKAVIRAILLDVEARGDFKTDPNYGKLREPAQLLTNVARHFNVRGASPGFTPQSDGVVNGLISGLGQSTFNSPTVFNFYPPDYIVPGAAIPGPEFALLTTGTAIGRANLMNNLVFSTTPVGINVETSPQGTSLNYSEMQALSSADVTGNVLVEALNQKMLHGRMSAQMRASILTAVTNVASTDPLRRAQQAVYLVATSSQYQIQR